MTIPKLLYHGTSALSVWWSYQNAKGLAKLAGRNPSQAATIIQAAQSQELFSRYGPPFPSLGYHARSRDRGEGVSLSDKYDEALGFALGWKSEPGADYLQLTCEWSRRELFLDPLEGQLNDIGEENIQVLQKLIGSNEPFVTPGAVLVVTGAFLNDNDLLWPAVGEEFAKAKYLPWSAIRGIYFPPELDAAGRLMLPGFHPLDPGIISDLEAEYLARFRLTPERIPLTD